MIIQYLSSILRVRVLFFIVKGFLETESWKELKHLFDVEYSSIVCFHEKQIVGIILHYFEEDYCFIHLTYVRPRYRRQKVYTRMFSELMSTVKGAGYASIEGITSGDNTPMLGACESTGRCVLKRYRSGRVLTKKYL